MDGLSVMDKIAEIQRDKKGNIIYDKETKDTELVKYTEDIEPIWRVRCCRIFLMLSGLGREFDEEEACNQNRRGNSLYPLLLQISGT